MTGAPFKTLSTQTTLDHLTITAPTLDAGKAFVRNKLGIEPVTGGQHPRMATHNCFVRLGESLFLEIIAPDPNAKPPGRPRWFALDTMERKTKPILKTWVVRTNNILDSLKLCSEPIGKAEPMSRGNTQWQISIPTDGSLPLNGCFPALIQWQTDTHPAMNMPDQGVSLLILQIHHPEPERITHFTRSINFDTQNDNPVEFIYNEHIHLTALIKTPLGIVRL